MADGSGTVRGTFDLNTPALGKMRELRREAGSTTTSMRELGNEMDRVGGPVATGRLDEYNRKVRSTATVAQEARLGVANAWSAQRQDIDREARLIESRIDVLDERVKRFGRTRSSATVGLSGVERVNLQLSELERRLDAFDRRRAIATVGVGGGFSNIAGAGGGGALSSAGGGGNFLGPLGNIPPMALGIAGLLPGAAALGGAATSLAGSAGAGALGAGAIGVGGLGALGVGGALTGLIAKPAVTDLQQLVKANEALQMAQAQHGPQSAQARTAQAKVNATLATIGVPSAGQAAQAGAGLVSAYSSASLPGRSAFYTGVAGLAGIAQRAVPQVGAQETRAVSSTMSAAQSFTRFLTGPQSMGFLRDMTTTFVQAMPGVERAVRNVSSTFEHLALAARPFFVQAVAWVDVWTHGLAASSSNEARVRNTMSHLVSTTRDWGRLGAAAFHTLKDVFTMGAPAGSSMVVSLTHTLDRWDQWIRDNPEKVKGFFRDARHTTDDIARALVSVVHLLGQVSTMLTPLFDRAMQFIGLAGGLGPLGLGGIAALGSGAYRGLTGGRGPSAGQIVAAGVLGRPIGGGRGGRFGGGATVGATAAMAAASSPLARATALEVAQGRTAGGAFLMGPATVGASAVLARRQAAAEANLAEASSLGRFAALRGVLTLSSTRAMLGRGASLGQDLVTGQGLARLAAGERLAAGAGGFARAGGMAVAGAARAFLPIAGLMALLQTTGQHNRGPIDFGENFLGNALNTVSFGAIPARIVHTALGSTPTGLSSGAIRGSQRALARQVSGATTSAQYSAILNEVRPGSAAWMAGGEMSPGQQRQWQAYLTSVSKQVAGAAGGAAAGEWTTAFNAGAQREGPVKAMKQMREGIGAQLKQLTPDGRRQFANSIGSWAAQMEAENPKLKRPIDRLMKTVTDTMRQMGQNVTYYNGMILDGSKSQWQQIGRALTDPIQVAEEKLAGSFAGIVGEAVRSLELMGFAPRNAHQLVTALQHGLPVSQVGQGAFTPQAMSAFSQTGGARHTTRGGRARGGVIGGSGLLDTVRVGDGGMAAPGEAVIANRHTMNDLSRATVEKYGLTAWQMIQREHRQHSEPVIQGDVLPGLSRGGHAFQLGGAFLKSVQQNIAGAGTGDMAAMISAANAITAKHYPYLWGGGHDANFTGPYDCSGAVSAVLHAGGLLTSPETSGGFMSYGLPGAGPVTLFANSGHVYMRLGNRYFGTSTRNPGGGAAWFAGSPRPGFVVRHVNATGGGAMGALTMGGAGAGAGFPPVSLAAPRSGLAGIGGVLVDQGSRMFAAGLSRRVNGALAGMSGPNIPGLGGGTSGQNQTLGRAMMLAQGWGPDQWPFLKALWTQESGWDANSVNRSSGAYGIPQALGHGHPFSLGDARGQIAWGLNYIRGRYGSPEAAEAHERAYNWYQRGGRLAWGGWQNAGGDFLTRGATLFGAGEHGVPERVSVTPARGGGAHSGSRPLHVTIEKIVMPATDRATVERVAGQVAQKLMDALEHSGGATDRELIR